MSCHGELPRMYTDFRGLRKENVFERSGEIRVIRGQ